MDCVYILNGIKYRYPKVRSSPEQEFELHIEEMTIRSGRLTAILGQSGSGKTTLFSLLGLLRKPTEGNFSLYITEASNVVQYTSEALWKNRLGEGVRGRHIGFVLQRGELLSFLSIRENVEMPLKCVGRNREERREEAEGLLRTLYAVEELKGGLLDSMPSQVSMGQYQRAALARALAHNPSIVLADEPTGNLDVIHAEGVIQKLKAFVQEAHRTALLITHRLDLAHKYADEIWVMQRGRNIEHYDRTEVWPTIEKLAADLDLPRMSPSGEEEKG